MAQDITPLELKAALLALSVTATLTDATVVPVVNNPLAWVINEAVTEARYENIKIAGYVKAADYQPAVVEIKYPLSGLNETGAASSLLLYPNPAVEILTLAGLSGGETISLLDLNGRIIAQTTAKGETANFAVSALAKGVYLVAVQNGGKVSVLKFVK